MIGLDFAMAEFYGVEDIIKTFNIITGREHDKYKLNDVLTERFCYHRDNGNYDFAIAYKDLLIKAGDANMIANNDWITEYLERCKEIFTN
jgi:hypothetical protein